MSDLEEFFNSYCEVPCYDPQITSSCLREFSKELNMSILDREIARVNLTDYYYPQRRMIQDVISACKNRINMGENVNDVCRYFEGRILHIKGLGLWSYLVN